MWEVVMPEKSSGKVNMYIHVSLASGIGQDKEESPKISGIEERLTSLFMVASELGNVTRAVSLCNSPVLQKRGIRV